MIKSKRIQKNYFFPLAAQFLSNLGDGVFIAGLTLAVADSTNSAKDLSLVLSMYSLPWLVFSLFAGSIIDRTSAGKIAVYTNFVRGSLLILLRSLFLGVKVGLPLLVIFSLFMGCLEVLFDNTFGVLLPSVVKPRELEQVNGIASTLEIVSNKFLGVNFGSLLLTFSLVVVLLTNSSFYFLSALILCFSLKKKG